MGVPRQDAYVGFTKFDLYKREAYYPNKNFWVLYDKICTSYVVLDVKHNRIGRIKI